MGGAEAEQTAAEPGNGLDEEDLAGPSEPSTSRRPGGRLASEAWLSHDFAPAPTVTPSGGAVVDPNATVVSWNAPGAERVGIIFENEDTRETYDVIVAGAATSLDVPPQFLHPGTEYRIEILAIAAKRQPHDRGVHVRADLTSARGQMKLTSAAFTAGKAIPRRFTCEGEDVSPALEWGGAPAGTRSFALIVEDPDAPDPRAPKRIWVHWVVVDIPAGAAGLAEAAGSGGLPGGAREGTNDWGRAGWGGPCPPIGRHRYFFRLYALDTVLGLVRPRKRTSRRPCAGTCWRRPS